MGVGQIFLGPGPEVKRGPGNWPSPGLSLLRDRFSPIALSVGTVYSTKHPHPGASEILTPRASRAFTADG